MLTGPFGLRDATDVCGGDELPAEAVAAGLSLLAERSVLLADRPAGHEARFVLPVTLRAYGGQMLRRLGQDQEYAARHSDGRTTAGRTRAARRGSERYDVAARPGAARIGLLAALARTHASRLPLQGLYSLTDSMILNFAWWIRASWWIRGSIVHQINPIARIHHGNFAAYRFNKHSFTRRPCRRGTAPG